MRQGEVTVAELMDFLDRLDPATIVRTMDYDQGFTSEIIEYWYDDVQKVVIIG